MLFGKDIRLAMTIIILDTPSTEKCDLGSELFVKIQFAKCGQTVTVGGRFYRDGLKELSNALSIVDPT